MMAALQPDGTDRAVFDALIIPPPQEDRLRHKLPKHETRSPGAVELVSRPGTVPAFLGRNWVLLGSAFSRLWTAFGLSRRGVEGWIVCADGIVQDASPAPAEAGLRRGPGGRQPGTGRKPTHGARIMRKTLRALTTKRLDGRSALAVAVRHWKEDVRRDLGGDISRAQETVLELAAQSWVIVSSLDDYIARQPSLVTRKRVVRPCSI